MSRIAGAWGRITLDLLEPHNLPFAAALCVMAIIAVVQLFGAADFFGDHDFGHDSDGAVDGLLSVFGIGRVPFLIWLALFLITFAGLGLGIQALAADLTGAPLDARLAALFAAIASLPVTAALSRPLGAILPGDETTAVTLDDLLGRRAHITDGVARRGSPARARVNDRHGMAHYVMVEPHEDASELRAGDEVLLVRREGTGFVAAELVDRALSPN